VSTPTATLVRAGLKTPRAAAVAGILFSILLTASVMLLRLSLPADPAETVGWLRQSAGQVAFALNLVPFAGIAFMWFLGVLRDRLGGAEDKFFATVFLGSGLMFLGMVFVAAAGIGGMVLAYSAAPDAFFVGSAFAFARAFTYDVMHIYAFKMAAVFMVATSTLAIRTQITPRWIAWLGYASALLILLGSGFVDWLLLVFPAWVLLVSASILLDNLRRPRPVAV
jgi:hypothetical protein